MHDVCIYFRRFHLINLSTNIKNVPRIHDPQTSFQKGRITNERIRTIFEVLLYVKEKDTPGLISFKDLKKSFYSIKSKKDGKNQGNDIIKYHT